jgi:nanoRNase/pAp phosphatase (c-di-AMP/oligoRNAs hydrolase)
MVKSHAQVIGNIVKIDLRDVDTIYAGNRFVLYTLYPEQTISIWVVDGRNKSNVAITVGHSIINRTSNTDVGSMLLHYGGGGHKPVGTCQVDYNEADKIIDEIIKKINSN